MINSKKSIALLLLTTTLASCGPNVNATTELGLTKESINSKAMQTTPRVTWVDKMFYSLNKNVELNGPIWINTEEKKNQYGERYMQTLIKVANKLAYKEFINPGKGDAEFIADHNAYNAFMMLAITIPLHEGLYMSFRQTNDEKGLCNSYVNGGNAMVKNTKKKEQEKIKGSISRYASKEEKKRLKKLKRWSKRKYKEYVEELSDKYATIIAKKKVAKMKNDSYHYFVHYLKEGKNPVVPECEDIKDYKVVNHLIKGGDGSDIGPMQVSVRWHYDDFLANKKYLSLEKSIEYALGDSFLMRDFKKVYYHLDDLALDKSRAKSSPYNCLVADGKVNYEKFIRGMWAGKYNSGQRKKACRIEQVPKLQEYEALVAKNKLSVTEEDRLKELKIELEGLLKYGAKSTRHHDYHFKNNLDKAISFLSKDRIGFNDSLSFSISKKTKAAVNEIIKNFNDGKVDGTDHSNVSNL